MADEKLINGFRIYKKRIIGYSILECPNSYYDITPIDTSFFKAEGNTQIDFFDCETLKSFIPASIEGYSVYCDVKDPFGDHTLLGYEFAGEDHEDWEEKLRKLTENL